MGFTVYDEDGDPRRGDAVVVQEFRDRVDEQGGWIQNDDTGEVVYGAKPDTPIS